MNSFAALVLFAGVFVVQAHPRRVTLPSTTPRHTTPNPIEPVSKNHLRPDTRKEDWNLKLDGFKSFFSEFGKKPDAGFPDFQKRDYNIQDEEFNNDSESFKIKTVQETKLRASEATTSTTIEPKRPKKETNFSAHTLLDVKDNSCPSGFLRDPLGGCQQQVN